MHPSLNSGEQHASFGMLNSSCTDCSLRISLFTFSFFISSAFIPNTSNYSGTPFFLLLSIKPIYRRYSHWEIQENNNLRLVSSMAYVNSSVRFLCAVYYSACEVFHFNCLTLFNFSFVLYIVYIICIVITILNWYIIRAFLFLFLFKFKMLNYIGYLLRIISKGHRSAMAFCVLSVPKIFQNICDIGIRICLLENSFFFYNTAHIYETGGTYHSK